MSGGHTSGGCSGVVSGWGAGLTALLLHAASSPCTLERSFGEALPTLQSEGALKQAVGELRVQGSPPLPLDSTLPLSDRRDAVYAQLHSACVLFGLPASPSPDPSERRRLESILGRPELSQARAPPLRDLLAWGLARALAGLERVFQSEGAQTYAVATRYLVLMLAALAALLGLRRLFRRRMGRVRLHGREHPRADEARLGQQPAADHLVRAQCLLADSPREALRETLCALLSALERHRLARPDRVTTNRELAMELPRRGAPPALVAEISPLLAWYDASFYSQQEVTSERAARFLNQVSRLTVSLEGHT